MRKVLIFDMDGTIADLYGVDGWLEMLRAENPIPYEIAEPMVDMNKLSTVLNELAVLGWTIAITSWLSMNSTQAYKNAVRKAKREWLAKTGLPIEEIHLVQYGTPKQKCTKGDIQILFDDSADVRESFYDYDRGRIAVNPTEIDIIDFLEDLIKNS